MKFKPIFRIFGIFYEQCNPVLGSKMCFCSQNFKPKYQILMYLEKQGFLVLSVLIGQNLSISTTK